MTLLLHPGFHKTATSWLQSKVFSDRRLFRSLMDHQEIHDLFVAPHDFFFDPAATTNRIASLREGASAGVVDVISSEILSGNIILGSRESAMLADRLGATCGEAKVLLTIRSQRSIIKSVYQQYVKRGGRFDIEDYLSFQPEPGYAWLDLETLKFDRVCDAYANHFGAENVLALPQELLKKDRVQYIRTLCGFAGLEETEAEREIANVKAKGVSPPAGGIVFQRMANNFRSGPLNPKPAGPLDAVGNVLNAIGYRWDVGSAKTDTKIKEAISSRVEGRYGEANSRLQKYAPVDLSEYGYDCG